nr:retrovirus-related Pol polyprotein from transposon TNT 1-94 [Tanacetum cinerariifolium]
MGYTWRPTGQTFTIVGNACLLTRITTTTEVPPRKPTVLETDTPKPVVTLAYSRKPRKFKTSVLIVQIFIWYLDSGCSKHMTRDRSQLTNFFNKFLGTVKFGNNHVEKIIGHGDYQIRNVMIIRVYYIEGLGYNLFSVGQLCDSNLEVAFHQHTCFICNLEGIDLLTGSQGNNLYTLSLGDIMASFPICLLSKVSKTKSWLWHNRLSHLNFGAFNHLARHGLIRGLPKIKFEKDHLSSTCAIGKSKKKPYKPKSKDTNQEKLYLPPMDLCGPMQKDEAPDFIIKFLKMIQLRVGISPETSVARSPQQNGVIERRNRTLIEAARTMLIYAKAPLYFWAKAVATASYTQNRSIIHLRHDKTPYELLHDKLSDLSFFYVFGALCYLTNNSENLGKLQPKAKIDRHGLIQGLPHLCSACAMRKIKKKPHKPKSEDANQEKLYILHMNLYGPMHVASVNGKKYILVIVDDYSRCTWVKCLRSKDKAPCLIIKFLKMIQLRLKAHVQRIRTDNVTEFVNRTLREYYEKVGISHETSVARFLQQNYVVERRNHTLIEAARTMLIYAKALLFL